MPMKKEKKAKFTSKISAQKRPKRTEHKIKNQIGKVI
jgi:hypothetical protein